MLYFFELADLDAAQSAPSCTQRAFSGKVLAHDRSRFVDFPETREERARVLSCGGEGAGGFLDASPRVAVFRWHPLHFVVALRLLLGMACGVTFRGQRCATCGEPVGDTGVHHLHCKGAHLISWHDSLVTTGVALWKSVRGRGGVLTEQLGYFGPRGGRSGLTS